jgi:Ca2+-transporting ATPase
MKSVRTPAPPVPLPGSGAPDPSRQKEAGGPGKHWFNQAADAVLIQLGTAATGLSAAEAARRLAADGPNELPAGQGISPWRIFCAQFKSTVIWILIVAGVLSAVLGEAMEAGAILAVVVLNAVIGFYQEFKAGRSIAALQLLTAPQAKVWRDGQIVSLPATGLVVGDVLALEAGDLVAADARLLATASLKCIESALTGESEAVKKRPATLERSDMPLGDRANLVFMGTSVAAGTGQAVVVATAMQTELGRIAGLLATAGAEARTPLERKLESFGRVLVWAALGIVVLLFGLGLLRGTKPYELFMTSVSLAVAAVPEGLPAIVTVALALGVSRMARRRALVRKLAAVETLGSTSVICTDKTGTLTRGEMTVRALFVAGQSYTVSGEGYGPAGEVQPTGATHAAPLRELASVHLGCNQAHLVEENGAWQVIGDPTEGAMLAAGAKAGGDRDRLEQEMVMQREFPFDSDRKRSSVVRRRPAGPLRVFCHGAPGALLERCTQIYTREGVRALTDEDRANLLAQTSVMARQALRVLGSAWRDLPEAAPDNLTADGVERDMVFVGLTGMYDPPRPEARVAIARCHGAGIRVVMITGDHPHTGAAIAQELGISTDGQAVTGVELDQLSDDDLRRQAPEVAVFARVTAEHKLRIVRALQARGAVVAMTGDGVNDAPAIKGADIGIAMGRSGTEVTRQAADMIITDDNFATIVAAVEEGRGIYANIRKTLQYLLAGSTAELLIMAICVIIGLPTPLLPIHLLWINLITDGLPGLCLATDPIDPDVMKGHPRDRGANIADGSFLRTMLFTGGLTAGITFAVFYHALQTETLAMARSQAFAVLIVAELLRAFGARSETKPVWRIAFSSNLNLVLVVAVSFGLQVWSQHSVLLGGILKTSAMSFGDGLRLLALGAVPLLVLELVKVGRGARRPPGPIAPPDPAMTIKHES